MTLSHRSKSKNKIFHVYLDWTCEETPRIFYVGKGDGARLRKRERNNHHRNIAQKYGHRREVVLMSSVEQLVLDMEIELIAEHKTFVYADDYVFGCNYTRGGDGISGYEYTGEQRDRTKEGHKRSWADPVTRQRRIVARNRPEVNDKLRVSVSATMRQNWADDDYRKRQSEAIKQAQNDPRTQVKRRASNVRAAIKQWSEKREVMLATMNSDEYREKQRLAHVGKSQRCSLCYQYGHKRSTCLRGQ